MEMHNFNDLFGKTTNFVRSGTKSVNESTEQIILTPTNSSFQLNNKACKALGVEKGGTVGVWDMSGTSICEDQESRYYISGDVDGGATLGAGNKFNSAPAYNTMLNGDLEILSITNRELVASGLMEERKKTDDDGKARATMYISYWKIYCDLVPIADGEEITRPDGTKGVFFQLTNFNKVAHTPRGGDEDDELELEAELEAGEAVEVEG